MDQNTRDAHYIYNQQPTKHTPNNGRLELSLANMEAVAAYLEWRWIFCEVVSFTEEHIDVEIDMFGTQYRQLKPEVHSWCGLPVLERLNGDSLYRLRMPNDLGMYLINEMYQQSPIVDIIGG